jgi:parallel beta-helix repeat protein
MVITEDTILEPGVYYLPGGISIAADNLTLDGNGALLVGSRREGLGLTVLSRSGVTIKNLHLAEYYHGIYARGCRGLTIVNCQATGTAEIPANTIFLDIWLPLDKAYGGGIFLAETEDSRVFENDLSHQMNGLLSYHNRRLEVRSNLANYCSGWGFHLYDTSNSLYEDNSADYCCRWEPRDPRRGHMGADAAGFLILYKSSNNIFRRNLARLGGDGFFLAGLTPDFEIAGSNDNLFEENDGSWSPNIAFEATFSSGNVYRNNFANHCNYGFWLGFSSGGVVENNQMINNVRAGIATENGYNFQVRGNTFQDSDHGVLLWSKHIPDFDRVYPQNDTSYNWQIEGNTFTHNNKAVRIAANQDHGIRPYQVPEGESLSSWRRPHDHILRNNLFKDNRIGIEALNADRTVAEGNTFEHNVEADQVEA